MVEAAKGWRESREETACDGVERIAKGGNGGG